MGREAVIFVNNAHVNFISSLLLNSGQVNAKTHFDAICRGSRSKGSNFVQINHCLQSILKFSMSYDDAIVT